MRSNYPYKTARFPTYTLEPVSITRIHSVSSLHYPSIQYSHCLPRASASDKSATEHSAATYNKPKSPFHHTEPCVRFVSDINMNSGANQHSCRPRTLLMLFLHALLCSLLATSTLAIPVPLGEDSEASTEAPDRVNGFWYNTGHTTVSEHRPFYIIWY